MREEIFANHIILLSEEIFTVLIFEDCIHNRRYIDLWIQNCVLGLSFVTPQDCKIHNLKTHNKFPLYSMFEIRNLNLRCNVALFVAAQLMSNDLHKLCVMN